MKTLTKLLKRKRSMAEIIWGLGTKCNPCKAKQGSIVFLDSSYDGYYLYCDTCKKKFSAIIDII